MNDSSPLPNPNLGELAGDVLSTVTSQGESNSRLVGVINGFVGTGASPSPDFERSTNEGWVEEIEGRTLVRHTILPCGISQSLAGSDSCIGEITPHSTKSDALSGFKVALKVKAVRLVLLGFVGLLTLFEGYNLIT